MQQPPGISTLNRNQILQELPAEKFDVIVIGGGIMGAGIALDAASRNLKVLLVEKQDFAAGTSSRSTKLIHGGLRYLKNFEFGLVRSVARERKILHHNAPHLVTPEPMLLPVLKNTSYGYLATALGLSLYDFLGKVSPTERHRMLGKKETLQLEPLLNPEYLKGAGYFYEYRTDDARLTLEVLKTAQAHGATCLNYTALTSFSYNTDKQLNGAILQDQLSGQTYAVNATCFINATGPWVTELMAQDQAVKGPGLYHTKGIHLVVPRNRLPLHQSVYFDIPGGRMLFAVPRNQITYLGTTDTPFTGNLEQPEVNREDAAYVLQAINQMFPKANLNLSDVVSSWAGVRALLYDPGKKPSEISRKDEIYVSASGLISVAGGKLTGYRHLAENVVDKARALKFPQLKKKSQTKNLTLSGGDFHNLKEMKQFEATCLQLANTNGLPPERIPILIQNYGSNTNLVLEKARKFKSQGANTEIALLKAEIWYAVTAEGATNLADFLIRRTGMLYFEREKIEGILPDVLSIFQEKLGWNDETAERSKNDFLNLYQAAVAFKDAKN
ncbi:glycerol-3-phosphate dehydrogenase/oxidase [Adhaeribacter soli]|uniref:Glycerol-3-phosphate dehydrogenase/oxidase n=1 Tax=Adhaeribacter soli TaxID=2607655 RepID=A0A5N1J4B2_9BACT|nr:glycerol-3-phosphate dehydrogenase/oxidase [Adhaeribacter soli]KAA9345746.1 glycerol-3-phosphate dehydrogenase/oxidase [Adhaeribacter soli]